MADSVSNPGTGSDVVSVDHTRDLDLHDDDFINSDDWSSEKTGSDCPGSDHPASDHSGFETSQSYHSEDNESAIEDGASSHSTQRTQSEDSSSGNLDYDNNKPDSEAGSQVSPNEGSPTALEIPVVPGRKTPSLDDFNLHDIKFSDKRLEAEDSDGNSFRIGYVRFNSVTHRNAWTEMDAIKSCTLEFRLAGLDFLPSDGQPNPVNVLATLYNDVVETIKKSMKEMKSAGKDAQLAKIELMRSANVLLEMDTTAYLSNTNYWNKDDSPWSGYLPQHCEILAMRFLDPKGSIPGEIAGMISGLGSGNFFTIPGAGINQARQSGNHDSSDSNELEPLKRCIMDLQQRVRKLKKTTVDSLVKLDKLCDNFEGFVANLHAKSKG